MSFYAKKNGYASTIIYFCLCTGYVPYHSLPILSPENSTKVSHRSCGLCLTYCCTTWKELCAMYEQMATNRFCCIYSWGDLSKCLCTPHKTLATEHRDNCIPVQFSDPVSWWEWLTEAWVRGYLQQHGWLKGGCIIEKLPLAWTLTDGIYISRVSCVCMCRQLGWVETHPSQSIAAAASITWEQVLQILEVAAAFSPLRVSLLGPQRKVSILIRQLLDRF